MSAPSQLNKIAFVLAVLSGTAHGGEDPTKLDPLSRYRTTGDVHGLYEIREAARLFLAGEQAKSGAAGSAGDPNLKIQVTRCAVPLTVNRVPKSAGYTGVNVSVNCRKTVLPERERNWTVIVPVHIK